MRIDAAGNLRALCIPLRKPDAPRLLIGSHLDTVPNAGAYDGVLGVVLAVALLEDLQGRQASFCNRGDWLFRGGRSTLRALHSSAAGRWSADWTRNFCVLDDAQGISVRKAIEDFGLNPAEISQAALENDALGYLEFHIEQGPVLEKSESASGSGRSHCRTEPVGIHIPGPRQPCRHNAHASSPRCDCWCGGVDRRCRTYGAGNSRT